MRIVVAIGGNALLKRGETLSWENQRINMREAAAALAEVAASNTLVLVHGNGPQVGLLALEADAYKAVPPYPLDALGAESQGMIGYLIAQEMRRALPARSIAALMTQTVVDAKDAAFARPSKPIGPVYAEETAGGLAGPRGWTMAKDGAAWRRVVASPAPQRIVEADAIRVLVEAGTLVVCTGGGGIPVVEKDDKTLDGVEAVIDKDLGAALLAHDLDAGRLVILTDVDGVYENWGKPEQRLLREVSAGAIDAGTFAKGSMGPKIEAACRFAKATGRPAFIGSLAEARAVIEGKAGTRIDP
ncbi:carbamate kinase, partial [Parvibaculum sp.]|uniref:carbamate kinase n=1 Tax=Parvibaculum sp. TaxID=2024848 RepID=UPI002BA0DA94